MFFFWHFPFNSLLFRIFIFNILPFKILLICSSLVFWPKQRINSLVYNFSCIVQQQELMKNKYSCSCLYSSLVHSFHSVTYQCLFLTLIFIGSSSSGLDSNIMCRFPERNQTIFWTGEFVSGNIEFTNSDHRKLKLKSIDVELIGVLGYKITRNTYAWESRVTHYKTFFNQRLNLNSTNKRDTFLLLYGNHQWPFRFFLNNSLPPSLKKKKSYDSFIHYYLQIVFTRSEWYKRNIMKKIPIVVKHASSPVDAMKDEVQAKNRKGVHLHVLLQKPVVAIGKNVSFDVQIQNPKEVVINRITVTLAQHLKLGPAQDRKLNLLNETLKTINQFKNPYLHENFQFHVSDTTPPTFSFHSPSSDKESPITISYELLFEAHLNGFSTNIRLQLPLIITDHPENNWANLAAVYEL